MLKSSPFCCKSLRRAIRVSVEPVLMLSISCVHLFQPMSHMLGAARRAAFFVGLMGMLQNRLSPLCFRSQISLFDQDTLLECSFTHLLLALFTLSHIEAHHQGPCSVLQPTWTLEFQALWTAHIPELVALLADSAPQLRTCPPFGRVLQRRRYPQSWGNSPS